MAMSCQTNCQGSNVAHGNSRAKPRERYRAAMGVVRL